MCHAESLISASRSTGKARCIRSSPRRRSCARSSTPTRHPDRPSFNAELIITSNHAATHVDAFGHYDASEGAEAIAEMPLDTFCGTAVCIDVRPYGGKGHEVTPAEVEDALGKDRA